jgi:hypothetical protein
MIQSIITHKDLMILLLNILADNKWKFGFELAQEIGKLYFNKNEFNSLGVYPVLIYMENKRIVQPKKRMDK